MVSDCIPSTHNSFENAVENTTRSKQTKTTKIVPKLPVETKKRKRVNGTTSKTKKQKLHVHETTLPTATSNSDSESESYIDRFFSSKDNESIASEEDTQIKEIIFNESATTPSDSSEEDEERENLIEECNHDHYEGHSSDYEVYSAEEVETDGESIQFSSSDSTASEETASKAKESNNGMELVTYSNRHTQEEDLTTSDDESCIYFDSSDSYNDSVPGESDESFDDNDNWSSFDSDDESSMEGSSFEDYDFEDDSLIDSSDESQTYYREFLSGRESDDPDDKEYTSKLKVKRSG